MIEYEVVKENGCFKKSGDPLAPQTDMAHGEDASETSIQSLLFKTNNKR
jgi:hypothetical protein